MGKIRKKFSPEYKYQVGQEVLSGKLTAGEACRKYQIASSTLAGWTAQLKTSPSSSAPAQVFQPRPSAKEKQLEKENLLLKEKLADLYLKVELLKKVDNFKQQMKNESSSIITSTNWDQFKQGVKS
jgi:transposase-like protein